VQKPIAFDVYEDDRTTGAFVLIDCRQAAPSPPE
jgi:sulfate adenylyltransferase subunit 1 (EFTu-like GTPase family)